VVTDFINPAGGEIELGNTIGAELRAVLQKGNQFHVYGKEHPVSQSLKSSLTADPQWSASSQRGFQQNLLKKFKPFPVDLIITGQVSQEAGNRLKVEASLIPFYKPISLVESESGRTDIQREQFLSPALSSQEIDKGLSVIQIQQVAKGRVVILSSMKIKKSKYPGPENIVLQGRAVGKGQLDFYENTGKNVSLKDLNFWLDDREITVNKDWEDFRKKEYHNLLAGFEADTIWFDDMIQEGKHVILFSLAQNHTKKGYKTFSEFFSIKGGTTNYLFFFIFSDSFGEPQVRIHHVVDQKNSPLPF
jgi:hypothetical protein